MNINKILSSAIAFQRAGRLHEAESLYNKILKNHPHNAEALHLLGVLHAQEGNDDTAIEYIRKSLSFNQHNFAAYYHLGNAFQRKGDIDKTIESFQKAIRLKPDIADIHYNLGIAFHDKGDDDNAIVSFRRALSLNPTLYDAYYNLGNIFRDKGEFDDAVRCYQKSIHLHPNFAGNYCNLGNVLKEKGRYDEAIDSYRKALLLNPDDSLDIYFNLGTIYQEKGQLEPAIDFYRKAIRQRPDFIDAHWNLSQAYLLNGNLARGWKEYEWRWQLKDFRQCSFSQPLWDGSSLTGKWIFVYTEQGIGDEIMFFSCLSEIVEQADQCIIECDKRLLPLFARALPRSNFIGRLNDHPDIPPEILSADMRISIGSLPKFLRPSLDSFPRQEAYLASDKQYAEMWLTRLRIFGNGLKIGISWKGGNYDSIRRIRSAVLSQWKELFSVPGVHFINLQYGDCAEELREAKDTLGVTIHDWEDADPLKDLDNFAAQVSALDLVISVDNSTVHMAGALGVPVWILLPFACDWRWMRDYEDTPWYKSVRLIRQEKAGDWDGVFQRAASDLKAYLETGLMPEIIRSYKSSLSTGTTAHEPAAPLLSLSSDTTYRCAVITPIGPGHETLYEESLASVKQSFAHSKGAFSEIIPIRIDDPEGKLGRSKARNLGIQKAAEYGVEWIFFLDADDLMSPSAFEYVAPYLDTYDGIWGSIWSIEKGETAAKERPKQLPFLYSIEDILSCDPFVTLQMGHFIRTRIALSTLFDESLDTGEDFDYYLRVWEKHRCIKTSLPFFYNRRGLHAQGPRADTGLAWRNKVEIIIQQKRSQLSLMQK